VYFHAWCTLLCQLIATFFSCWLDGFYCVTYVTSHSALDGGFQNNSIINILFIQGWPTHGPRATCGPNSNRESAIFQAALRPIWVGHPYLKYWLFFVQRGWKWGKYISATLGQKVCKTWAKFSLKNVLIFSEFVKKSPLWADFPKFESNLKANSLSKPQTNL
jgi:hypothetical protein